MPLDAQYKPTLAETVQWSGISPVPDVILDQHKQAEIDKHPASWGFKYAPHVRSVAALVPLSLAIALMFLPTDIAAAKFVLWLAPLVCGLSLVTMLTTALFRPKGPARWIENYRCLNHVVDDAAIPLPIRDLAVEMASLLPSSWFVVGELVQHKIVLDPYLMIVHGGERICIGVWDGIKIIHIAQKA